MLNGPQRLLFEFGIYFCTFAVTSACDWLSWLTEFQLTNHRQRSQQ